MLLVIYSSYTLNACKAVTTEIQIDNKDTIVPTEYVNSDTHIYFHYGERSISVTFRA